MVSTPTLAGHEASAAFLLLCNDSFYNLHPFFGAAGKNALLSLGIVIIIKDHQILFHFPTFDLLCEEHVTGVNGSTSRFLPEAIIPYGHTAATVQYHIRAMKMCARKAS